MPREFTGRGWYLGSTAMLRTADRGRSLQVWKRREEQKVLQWMPAIRYDTSLFPQHLPRPIALVLMSPLSSTPNICG